jgi:hypothetical protein
MTTAIIIGVLVAAFLALCARVVWLKFFKPYREWPVSTPISFGTSAINTTPEEPFFSWWKAHRDKFGGHYPITLTGSLRRKIDHITVTMGWEYFRDGTGVDWEPVTDDQTMGDCEDYARVLAAKLISTGIPGAAMTFVIGERLGAGWHCMLLLNTTDGGYFAEVGASFFLPWRDIKRLDSPGSPKGWIVPGSDGLYYLVQP